MGGRGVQGGSSLNVAPDFEGRGARFFIPNVDGLAAPGTIGFPRVNNLATDPVAAAQQEAARVAANTITPGSTSGSLRASPTVTSGTVAPTTTPQTVGLTAPTTATIPTATPPASTTVTTSRNTGIENTLGGFVNNPTLPAGTEITPELLTAGQGDFLQTATELDTGLGAAAPTVGAPTTETDFDITGAVGDITAPELDVDAQTAEVLDPATRQAAQFEASLLSDEQIQSALVSTELERLLDFEAGDVPRVFRGAVLEATAAANARGLGASTIAAEAIASGLVNAALPIAQGNSQVRLNAMLSNQGALNAALQFNAESKNQVSQFYDNLKTQIDQFNVAETNRLNLQKEQTQAQLDLDTRVTNAQNELSAATTSAELSAASERLQSELDIQAAVESARIASEIEQFNAGLSDARERFNIDNQLIIDQSNVAWRRIINTENTASINAANETNAANLLGLSNFALSSLWQEFRDDAFWAWTSGENVDDRAHNLALAAFDRSTLFDQIDQAEEAALFTQIGQFALNLLGRV